MKPFSPLYFIKENKLRCILLMLMIFLGYGAYLGGLYIATPQKTWEYAYDIDDGSIMICPSNDDKSSEQFTAFCDELSKHDEVSVIWLGWYNSLDKKSVMGFTDGAFCRTFRSVDDFRIYCEHFGIECDFSSLGYKSLIVSRYMADCRGLKIGDVISKSEENYVHRDFTVSAITDEPGYTQYFIGNEEELNDRAMLLPTGTSYEQLEGLVRDISEEHNVYFDIPLREDIGDQYTAFDRIFVIVIVFLAIILAVTVNAAFVGMYQRRELEFAVYRAIGISKKRLIGKIVGEIILMDLIVLIVGGAVFFTGLYLLNDLLLVPKGLYIVYYAPIALYGLVVCNIITVIPLIITRSRTLLRADVCNY